MLVQIRHAFWRIWSLLHARIHVIAGGGTFRWKALVWGCPWLRGHPSSPSWLATHRLAFILLQAGLMALVGMRA